MVTRHIISQEQRAVDLRQFHMLECIEEVRSRLVSIRSDFEFVTKELEAVSDSYQKRKQVPPCLFPERIVSLFRATFAQVEQHFQYLILLHNSSDLVQCVREIQRLNSEIGNLVCGLNALQGIAHQRLSSFGNHQLEDNQSLPLEVFDKQKIYHAADALCYNIFDAIMGATWVRNRSYFPLTYFGDKYAVLLPHNIVEIASYDICRNRFWGKVAHEIGHMKIYEERRNKRYKKTLDQFVEDFASWPTNISPFTVQSQFIELLSDIIGVYVCGPSALLSALSSLPLDLPLYNDSSAQIMPSSWAIDATRELSHPPLSIRITVMHEALKLADIEEKWMNPLAKYAKSRTIEAPNLLKYGWFLLTYEAMIKEQVPQMYSLIEKLCGKKAVYNQAKWNNARNVLKQLKTESTPDTTPIDILNAIWLSRKDTFKSTNIATFLLNRRFEGKYFEVSVEKMVDWYSGIKI